MRYEGEEIDGYTDWHRLLPSPRLRGRDYERLGLLLLEVGGCLLGCWVCRSMPMVYMAGAFGGEGGRRHCSKTSNWSLMKMREEAAGRGNAANGCQPASMPWVGKESRHAASHKAVTAFSCRTMSAIMESGWSEGWMEGRREAAWLRGQGY